MGLDEPVKLLNSEGYEEWKYAELKADNLAREFFSRGNALDKEKSIQLISDWICYGNLANMDSTELWDWCDELCNTIDVERRGNRSYFEQRLKEYAKKYRDENREQLREHSKKYREENIEEINEQRKKYRDENKQKIKERKSQKIECECGLITTKNHQARHKRTKKHLELLKLKTET